jgi:hypothetical protein
VLASVPVPRQFKKSQPITPSVAASPDRLMAPPPTVLWQSTKTHPINVVDSVVTCGVLNVAFAISVEFEQRRSGQKTESIERVSRHGLRKLLSSHTKLFSYLYKHAL